MTIWTGGFAWKRTQLDYKNTPVNAPIIILALRLYQIEKDPIYLETSKRTLAWMKEKLVHPDSQFVEDGINRNGDGKLDEQWRFTYNQGVYIGALLEFYQDNQRTGLFGRCLEMCENFY
jgi:predicted alpha-1,6-mannanase (GH76 family)